MIKGSDGNLAPASWEDALVTVAKILDSTPSDQIAAVAGGLVDGEVIEMIIIVWSSLHLNFCSL